MATFVFDTHRAVKDLEEAGFPEAQAEALVEIVGAAVGENAATKADLDAMEGRMNVRVDNLEQRMEARFEAQEKQTAAQFAAQKEQTEAQFTAMEQQMAAQEQRLNARIDAVEQRLSAEIHAVRADMRNMEQRITLRFLLILLPGLGLLFAALRFLPG